MTQEPRPFARNQKGTLARPDGGPMGVGQAAAAAPSAGFAVHLGHDLGAPRADLPTAEAGQGESGPRRGESQLSKPDGSLQAAPQSQLEPVEPEREVAV